MRDKPWSSREFLDLFWFTGDDLMCFLRAFIDTSTRPGGTFVLAACLFTKDQAERFQEKWDRLFKQYGGLHAKEFMHRQGRFRRLTEAERDGLLKRAAHVFTGQVEACVVVGCNLQDVTNLGVPMPAPAVAAGFSVGNAGYRSPYAVCCRVAVLALDGWCKRHGRSEQISYVLEAGDQDQAEALEFFHFSMRLPRL